MSDLFTAAGPPPGTPTPLAEKLRPRSLDEVVGQSHLLGEDGSLKRLIQSGQINSLIFWGPPGTGKTTVARLLARETSLQFEQISAIFSGVADLKKVFELARQRRLSGSGTLLFVDEIHRFNRAQQDAFLPVMEEGSIVLIGATTENPSFELNGALLSRARVLTFQRLDEQALADLALRAEGMLERNLPLDEEAREILLAMADGDGRALLGLIDDLLAVTKPDDVLAPADLVKALDRRAPLYDKGQDGHFNFISALHKSVRGSDPDASLYYLARMLEAGEQPLYILRRMVRMASEDIGLADPRALEICLAAKESYDFLGSPEGELAMMQAVVYLALAPKSNAIYKAAKAALRLARETGSLPPPKVILNAPTALMKREGYGDDYLYDHDAPDAFSGQDYFPTGMARPVLYEPTEFGVEARIKARFDDLAAKRSERQKSK